MEKLITSTFYGLMLCLLTTNTWASDKKIYENYVHNKIEQVKAETLAEEEIENELSFSPTDHFSNESATLEVFARKGNSAYFESVAIIHNDDVIFDEKGHFSEVEFSSTGQSVIVVGYESQHQLLYYTDGSTVKKVQRKLFQKFEPSKPYIDAFYHYFISDDASLFGWGDGEDDGLEHLYVCSNIDKVDCVLSHEDKVIVDISFFNEGSYFILDPGTLIKYHLGEELFKVSLEEYFPREPNIMRIYENKVIIVGQKKAVIIDAENGDIIWHFNRPDYEERLKQLHHSYIEDGFFYMPFKDDNGFIRKRL